MEQKEINEKLISYRKDMSKKLNISEEQAADIINSFHMIQKDMGKDLMRIAGIYSGKLSALCGENNPKKAKDTIFDSMIKILEVMKNNIK